MQTKNCYICKKEQPFRMFYRNKHTSSGRRSACKACSKERRKTPEARKADALRSRRYYNIEKSRLYEAQPKTKAMRRRAHQKRKHTVNFISRQITCLAVKAGIITKTPCAVCGDKVVQGHHEDYYKPLDVIWLCRKHHGERHRKYKED